MELVNFGPEIAKCTKQMPPLHFRLLLPERRLEPRLGPPRRRRQLARRGGSGGRRSRPPPRRRQQWPRQQPAGRRRVGVGGRHGLVGRREGQPVLGRREPEQRRQSEQRGRRRQGGRQRQQGRQVLALKRYKEGRKARTLRAEDPFSQVVGWLNLHVLYKLVTLLWKATAYLVMSVSDNLVVQLKNLQVHFYDGNLTTDLPDSRNPLTTKLKKIYYRTMDVFIQPARPDEGVYGKTSPTLYYMAMTTATPPHSTTAATTNLFGFYSKLVILLLHLFRVI